MRDKIWLIKDSIKTRRRSFSSRCKILTTWRKREGRALCRINRLFRSGQFEIDRMVILTLYQCEENNRSENLAKNASTTAETNRKIAYVIQSCVMSICVPERESHRKWIIEVTLDRRFSSFSFFSKQLWTLDLLWKKEKENDGNFTLKRAPFLQLFSHSVVVKVAHIRSHCSFHNIPICIFYHPKMR